VGITDTLHLLPFIITSLIDFDVLDLGFYLHAYTDGTLKLLSLVVYGYMCYKISDRPIWKFVRMVIAAEAVIVITLAVMVVYYGRFPDVRVLFAVLTFLIYWVTYKVISRSVPFREEGNVVMMQTRKSAKYAHSGLKQEEADRIEKELYRIMVEEKAYLDASLTIDAIAPRLSTTRHNVSRVINERLGKTWTDYLNELRLEESRKRLSDPSNFRFTIAAIAHDSGFPSVSNFNDVFKKRYRITPSKFRNQFLDRLSA